MSSNIGQATTRLDNYVDRLDMQRRMGSRSLGGDIAHKAIELIQDRNLINRTSHGTVWVPNSETPSHWCPEGYKAWKEEHYGTGEPNGRIGQVLSKRSLYCRTTVDSKQVTLIYGTNKPSDRGTFGDVSEEDLEQDRKQTDVEQAYFAHTVQSKEQIVSPFYQLIDSHCAEIVELCPENLSESITDTNRASGY
jgi:hypothetical protein